MFSESRHLPASGFIRSGFIRLSGSFAPALASSLDFFFFYFSISCYILSSIIYFQVSSRADSSTTPYSARVGPRKGCISAENAA